MSPRDAVKKSDEFKMSGVLNENDVETVDGGLEKPQEGFAGNRTIKLVWLNISLFGILHVAAVYGFWLMLTSAQWRTIIFG